MRWRFLNTGPQAGDYNMALDAAMAQSGFINEPTLRVFKWNPDCISLGYHQNAGEVDLEKCRRVGIDVARRPTGGRAILHAQELTYSVVIPATHPWFEILPLDIYRRLSEAIAAGLRHLGAAVNFAPGEKLHVDGRPLRLACFASAARNELLAGGKKIVGSAQRKFRLEDHTTTLRQVCGREISFDETMSALRRGFAETWQIDFFGGVIADDENRLAEAWRERFQILNIIKRR
jgi:lipoate-protein ligase A